MKLIECDVTLLSMLELKCMLNKQEKYSTGGE